MKRLMALALVVVAAALVSEVAATVQPQPASGTPASGGFPLIFYLEVLLILIGGVSGLTFLVWRPANAPGMFGVGLYTLIMGLVFFTIFPLWLSLDWIEDAALVLAAVLAILGLVLLLVSGALLAGRPAPRAIALGALAGPGLLALGWAAAFLGARSGTRTLGISPAVLLAGLALLVLGSLVLLVGHRRRVIVVPVLLASLGAAFTIALLLARGPDDWATGAPSLHLYSFPIALVGKALSLAILHVSQHYHEHGVPWTCRPSTATPAGR